MATNLKPVNVAVIGLGAAGGVAVLPLARAGLKVAGIEAGTWMDVHTFKPDEIYNNVRRLVTSVPKAQLECPTIRANPSQTAQPARPHPMMNAIGGTSIHYWAQSWRLKAWDFRTRSEALARYGPNAIPKGSTLELYDGGGGGYGPPGERDPDAVRADIREGYYSEEFSRRHYPHAFEEPA